MSNRITSGRRETISAKQSTHFKSLNEKQDVISTGQVDWHMIRRFPNPILFFSNTSMSFAKLEKKNITVMVSSHKTLNASTVAMSVPENISTSVWTWTSTFNDSAAATVPMWSWLCILQIQWSEIASVPWVSCVDMGGHIAPLGSCIRADGAFVWPLSCVRVDVTGQVSCPSEGHATANPGTGVWPPLGYLKQTLRSCTSSKMVHVAPQSSAIRAFEAQEELLTCVWTMSKVYPTLEGLAVAWPCALESMWTKCPQSTTWWKNT